MRTIHLMCALIGSSVASSISSAPAALYEVGDGKPFASIGAVPWESLQAGDTVLISWRPAPYKEEWVIARQGTAEAPITVRGVSGPGGERPVIDGKGQDLVPPDRAARGSSCNNPRAVKDNHASEPPGLPRRSDCCERLSNPTGARG
jgi:hypothetical protein